MVYALSFMLMWKITVKGQFCIFVEINGVSTTYPGSETGPKYVNACSLNSFS